MWRAIPPSEVTLTLISVSLSLISILLVVNCFRNKSWTACVKNMCSGRLIADKIETTKLNNLGFLFAMDIGKAFDSFDHTFLFIVLKKIGICSKLHFLYRNSYMIMNPVLSMKERPLNIFGSKAVTVKVTQYQLIWSF